ncbi:MAG: hypothetical protein Q4D59_08160 [Erysipelotrichaceae bacterium]|nr:hypothetical protein [Erysipelotrichaceae bacterium]
MQNYWNRLAGDDLAEPADFFLKIKELYTACLKHLYNDPKYIPDFRIHFAVDQRSVEAGDADGWPVCTVSRKSSQVSEIKIRDFRGIENFENSYTWYQDDVFVVFDYRAETISPLLFITRSFWNELHQQIEAFGIRKLRISYMYEPLIAAGVMEFFYSYYRLDVNLVTTLTALTYEKAFINATVYAPKYDGDGEKRARNAGLDIVFSQPVPFLVENLRQVRKLMEMSDKKIALVVNRKGDICGMTSEPPYPGECLIRLWGHLTWTITFDGGKLSYYDARYHMHTDVDSDTDALQRMLSKLSQENMEKIETVIREAVHQRHGTILIFGSDADIQSESDRLRAAGNATGIQKTSLYEKVGLLNYLTSIDGAMFLNEKCECSCIGAILDGDAVTAGSTARGARFNSTVNYIVRRSQTGQRFFGIVVSEDGTVDAVTPTRITRLNLRS